MIKSATTSRGFDASTKAVKRDGELRRLTKKLRAHARAMDAEVQSLAEEMEAEQRNEELKAVKRATACARYKKWDQSGTIVLCLCVLQIVDVGGAD